MIHLGLRTTSITAESLNISNINKRGPHKVDMPKGNKIDCRDFLKTENSVLEENLNSAQDYL